MKHIKRLIAAALTLGMTLLSLTACDSGAEYEPVNFVLGHVGAASDVNLLQRFAEKFKNDVEEKSHGQVTIEIHPGGELGGERDLVEGVQLGTIDMALSSSNVLGNFVSDVFAFDFPFLFKDEAHAARVFDGDIGQEMRQKVIAGHQRFGLAIQRRASDHEQQAAGHKGRRPKGNQDPHGGKQDPYGVVFRARRRSHSDRRARALYFFAAGRCRRHGRDADLDRTGQVL